MWLIDDDLAALGSAARVVPDTSLGAAQGAQAREADDAHSAKEGAPQRDLCREAALSIRKP